MVDNASRLKQYSLVLLVAVVIKGAVAPPASIRQVEFKAFIYPFVQPDRVPDALRWMSIGERHQITLTDGTYHPKADSDVRYSESMLKLDTVQYGKLDGIPGELSAVVMTFHTGGTANWQYVYLYSWESHRAKLLGWFETGSRAGNGLYRLHFDRGSLVVELLDPEKREGECCSSGFIRTQYKWQNGAFQQTGLPTAGDIPPSK